MRELMIKLLDETIEKLTDTNMEYASIKDLLLQIEDPQYSHFHTDLFMYGEMAPIYEFIHSNEIVPINKDRSTLDFTSVYTIDDFIGNISDRKEIDDKIEKLKKLGVLIDYVATHSQVDYLMLYCRFDTWVTSNISVLSDYLVKYKILENNKPIVYKTNRPDKEYAICNKVIAAYLELRYSHLKFAPVRTGQQRWGMKYKYKSNFKKSFTFVSGDLEIIG